MSQQQAKNELLKAIEAKGKAREAHAVSAAVDAARDPSDEGKRYEAHMAIRLSDFANQFAKDVMQLVLQHLDTK